MSRNYDDHQISGDEFKIRRFAIGLEQPQIMAELGVSRPIIDKWQSGKINVPRRVRELLEMCETDVQAMVDDFVSRQVVELPVDAPEGWPWSEKSWFVVVSRSRSILSDSGVSATITKIQ